MKKALLFLAAVVLSVGGTAKSCATVDYTTVYAEQLPFTVHAAWDYDSTIVQYQVVTDAAQPITYLAKDICNPQTGCLVAITVSSYGKHTTSVVAQNYLLDVDQTPDNLQTSTPATVAWALNATVNPVSKITLKK